MKNKEVAVILSGCGHMDGAEIRESVIVLLELDKHGARSHIFAPGTEFVAINHLTGQSSGENRNALIEAARIARGEVRPIEELDEQRYDALILPGGFGVAKNLSNIANEAQEKKATKFVQEKILAFWQSKKPIGAICIAPALVTLALKEQTRVNVTLGDKNNRGMIENLGGSYSECSTDDLIIDKQNKICSCSAYMRGDAGLYEVAEGIRKVVEAVLELE
jgi:enhancing lycopene biosynthesis protein 2